MFRVEKITSTDGVSAICREWEVLLEQIPNHSFFLTWDWLATWWEIFGKGKDLWWLLVRDESGKLIGGAPLYIRKLSGRAVFPVREMRFVGAGECVSPEHLDILSIESRREETLIALSRFLESRSGQWDILCLSDVSQSNSCAYELSKKLSQSKAKILTLDQNPSAPYIILPKSWDEFLTSAKKSTRHNVERRRRKATRELEVSFSVWSPVESNVLGALDKFASIHGRRKEQQGIENKFSDNGDYRRFHNKLVERVASRNQLYLAFLNVKDHAIAGQYAFNYRGCLYGYQTGFDIAYSKWGALQVLMSHILEDAIAKGLTEFDQLRGEEPYKFDWTDKVRRKRIIFCYSPTPQGFVIYVFGMVRRLLARWLRIVKSEGIKGINKRVIGLFFRTDRFLFLKNGVGQGNDSYIQKNGIVYRFAGADEQNIWKEVTRLKEARDSRKSIKRIRRGHICAVGIKKGIGVVYFGWMSPNEWLLKDGKYYPLPVDTVFCYDSFTVETMRGKGIAREANRFMLGQLKALGKSTLYTLVREDNVASLRSFEAVGFEAAKVTLKRLKVFGFQTALNPPKKEDFYSELSGRLMKI